MTVQESTAVAAEEEQHFHADEPETDSDMEARARWAAATVILSYMGKGGLTSAAGECPHCDCGVLYIHDGPQSPLITNECAYECIRCGATTTMSDHRPATAQHLAEYLAEVQRAPRAPMRHKQ